MRSHKGDPTAPSKLEPAVSVTARTTIELLREQRRTNELLEALLVATARKG
jgi:hypothetical protein